MREDESKSFIGNIFEGVDKVIFGSNEELSHMVSKDGEEVHLHKEVLTRPNIAVDKWLAYFEQRMKETVKLEVFHAFEHMDI